MLTARDILLHYNVVVETEFGTELRCKCPFHDDHNPSLDMNTETAQWICRAGCGGGTAVQFIMRMESVSYAVAKMLYENDFSLIADNTISRVLNTAAAIRTQADEEHPAEPNAVAQRTTIRTVLASMGVFPPKSDVLRVRYSTLVYLASETPARTLEEYEQIVSEFAHERETFLKGER